MTDSELVKTILSLRYFSPPDGVEMATVVRSKPGVCGVGVELWSGKVGREYRFRTPPDEDALRSLYRDALEIAGEARNATHEGEGEPTAVYPPPLPLTPGVILGLDITTIGGDQ